MPNTFELIASSTVGSGGASDITFSSIASTWTDLVVKGSLRGSRSDFYDSLDVEFNGSAGSSRYLYGIGSSGSQGSGTFATRIRVQLTGATATSNTFANFEMYVPNYTSSNYKSTSIDAVGENNATDSYANLSAGLWSSSSAITSIKLYFPSFNILQHSTAYLYGVKNA
jgi:hypothetical protein